MSTQDIDQYVRENRDRLRKIAVHGNDKFARSLALAALVEYGDDPDLDAVVRDAEKARQMEGSA